MESKKYKKRDRKEKKKEHKKEHKKDHKEDYKKDEKRHKKRESEKERMKENSKDKVREKTKEEKHKEKSKRSESRKEKHSSSSKSSDRNSHKRSRSDYSDSNEKSDNREAKIQKTASHPSISIQSPPKSQPTPSTKNLSAAEKRKLLWGKRDEKTSTAETTTVWAAADLGDDERKQKFLKLMGASAASAPTKPEVTSSMDKKEIEKRFDHLENEFKQSVKANRSRGLGLGF